MRAEIKDMVAAFLFGAGCMFLGLAAAAYFSDFAQMQRDCEKDLPRSQQCRAIYVPPTVPDDQHNRPDGRRED